jgi:nicotinamide mononucleotide transporter
MASGLEIGANAVNALSILLAARNSIHTWWTGILGCALFGSLFFLSRLYADSLLQLFFIVTSAVGWWQWLAGGDNREALPVTRVAWSSIMLSILAASVVAGGYGYLLWRFTDAFAPFLDSLILALSVAAQILLMYRKYESWWFWLAVNTLSVVLFGVRGLWVTAGLYTIFWINAAIALVRWRRLVASQ